MVSLPLRPARGALVAAALLHLPGAGAAWGAAPPAAAPVPAPVDPLPEMAPLPGLGVDWPDPARIDSIAAPTGVAPGRTVAAATLARYRVELTGADDLGAAFRTRFHQLSVLIADEGKPANAAQVDRRAHEDVALLQQLLRAGGRYDGTVASTIAVAPDGTSAIVRLTVVPGPLYRFGTVALPGAAPARDAVRAFAVHPGDAVDADAVDAAIAQLKVALGRQGYPFAQVADPDIVVDHATQRASLGLAVTLGTRARFGRIVTSGPRPLFSERHLADIARFHPGDPYDASRLEDFRRALIATGLVSAATVAPAATPDPAVVNVAVRIDRAPPRTVSGELGYGTGTGARAALSWQHRNFAKPEGALTVSAVGGTQEQSLGVILRRSNFHARDRILTTQAIASHTNYDAYDARTLTLGASLERQTNIIWQKRWFWSVGAEFVATAERASSDPNRHTYLVAAAPTSLSFDGTDDLLNPTRGFRVAGRVSPELSLQNGADAYLKAQLDASAYLPLGQRLVFAGRLRFGSITGAPLDSIAPSRRFYAGGGGSVRGYSYQAIGPRDAFNQPIGGRGLTEFGAEARVRFGNFGIVPFLDAGNLYRSSMPKLTGLRFGTGLGVRYYSSFGPIRVDVGTPIARRPGESRIGVYVSLGQAF